MSVSKLLPASGNNDFNVSITGTYTVVTFTKEYSAGAYTLTSSLSDTSYDIYLINSNGTAAGYTNSPGLTATQGFNKMVILGGTAGDVIGFSFKTTYSTENETTEVLAGPVITSVSPSDMPKANDTITVTGRNFASDVAISFTNTGYGPTNAKNIVRSSATSLIVTRPDTFPVATSAYTITASNPGVTAPTGSNSHILATSVTAGNAPVWSTNATLPSYTKNVAYSTTLVATDSSDAGSTITYSIVSGLPTGFTFASTSGVLSGTSTSSIPLTSIVARATDSGGNYVDRTFTIPNTGPVWSTTGALTAATSGSAYTFTLSAPDDSGTTPTFALVSGALPTGLTLASASGVISGTPTVGSNGTSSTFVISATDANGVTTNSGTLSLYVASLIVTRFTTAGSFTPQVSGTITVALVAGGGGGGRYNGSGNVGSGGGGAGGCLSQTLSVTAGTSYAYTVGAGGSAVSGSTASGGKGTDSTFAGLTTAIGGGGGFGSQMSTNGWITSPFTGVGGSGGGGGESVGASGTAGQGNNGGVSAGQYGGGGGGGAGGAGQGGNPIGTNTSAAGNGGAGTTLLTYSVGGGGGGGRAGNIGGSNVTAGTATNGGGAGGLNSTAGSGTPFTGGGGGGSDSQNASGAGGSGAVIIQYLG